MNTTFENFEATERHLTRSLFTHLGITDYTLSEIGDYSGTDGEYTDKDGFRHRFEIKVRQFPRDQYQDHILEAVKMAKLLKYYKQGYRIDYINFFKELDGTYSAIIYNLTGKITKWKQRGLKGVRPLCFYARLPERTALGSRNYKNKFIMMLELDPDLDTVITQVPVFTDPDTTY